MNAIHCCYKCPDRHLGCHGKCARYQKEREQYERRKEVENENRKNASELDTFDRFSYWR